MDSREGRKRKNPLFADHWKWVAISLGSNQGDRLAFLARAMEFMMKGLPHRKMKVSSIYRTRPVDCKVGGYFLNAVASFQTHLVPRALLQELQDIETRLGRTRPFPNAPRTIDLDILLYGNKTIRETDLQIPHPRLHHRLFALVPLLEIGYPLPHPVLQQSMAELHTRAQSALGARDVIELSQTQWPFELPR